MDGVVNGAALRGGLFSCSSLQAHRCGSPFGDCRLPIDRNVYHPERSRRACKPPLPPEIAGANTHETSTRPSKVPSVSLLRRTFLSNFPTLVLGTSSTNANSSGSHHLATRPRRCSSRSSAVVLAPSRSTTQHRGRSAQRSSGLAITAASITSGCDMTSFSSSTEEIHSPPDLITSLARSVICTKPF